MAELFTNNARSSLAAAIASTDLALNVQSGDGALFPSPTAADFFRATLYKKATGEIEIAFVSAVSGDIFTISRGEEGTTALDLNAGDLVQLRPTAGFFSSLAVTSLQIQDGAFNTDLAAAGSANAYTVTLSPAPTSMADGLHFYWRPSVANTGASTINVNGLGIVPLVRPDGSALSAGDITAGVIAETFYDANNNQAVLLSVANHAESADLATDSDNLGGQTPAYYLALANATGVLPPAQISPQGAGSTLDADLWQGKPRVVDHGVVTVDTAIDLSDADIQVIEFGADATLSISSANANDKSLVVIKNGGYTITLAGIDNESPTLTEAASTQDFLGIVSSFGKITCVGFVPNEPTV